MADYRQCMSQLGLSFVLKEKQTEILKLLETGNKEIMAILPTGYGKSLIFMICPLLLKGKVIVFSPLSVIQQDQMERLRGTSLRGCILNVKVDFLRDERVGHFFIVNV